LQDAPIQTRSEKEIEVLTLAKRNSIALRVRSGGPLMTVTGVQGDQVNCTWADWDGRLWSCGFRFAGGINLPERAGLAAAIMVSISRNDPLSEVIISGFF
jgi:hypothetical protein